MAVVLSAEQEKAAKGILQWLYNPNRSNQSMVLAGYAGTGKTTLVTELLKRLPHHIRCRTALVSYTGKASDVLSAKLAREALDCEYVGTIHSLFYQVLDSDESKVEFERRAASVARGGRVKRVTKDSELPCISLTIMGANGPQSVVISFLVVDELSMIDAEMYKDLSSFGIPILYCGDNFQNGPVNGGTAERLTKPDYRLVTVHRQALDNPIVQVATDVRQGAAVPMGQLGQEFIHIPKKPQLVTPLVDRFIDRYFVQKKGTGTFLCAKNQTRRMFNRRTREKLGYDGENYPQVGEIVVCLRNNKSTGLKNGTLCMVTGECTPTPGVETYGTISVMNLQTNQTHRVYCYLPTFYGEVDWEKARDDFSLHFFDYGYALTVHKSQGSEWDAVVLFNGRMSSQTDLEYQKWLYTGITRASKKLIMVG